MLTAALGALAVAAALPACTKSDGAAPRPGSPAPASTEVRVAFGLSRDDDKLADLAREVSDPASPRHLRFPSYAEVRRRFGASADTVADARRKLAAQGIRGAELDATGSVLTATVDAGQVRRVLDRRLVVQQQEDGSRIVVPDRDPEVPSSLAGPIEEVVGLTATVRPALGTATAVPRGAVPPDPGCEDPDLAADESVAETLRYFGTKGLYDDGHDGDGVTIALWAVEAYDPAPVDAFARCRESPTVQPEVVTVPGTPDAPPGPEVTLDVIMAGWTAPGADLVVVRTDPAASPVLALDQTLATSAARPEPVALLSTSISFCETALPDPELDLAEHQLLALAATGTTVVAAAGDHGVAGCWPSRTDPLAAYPASSPWATAVGGTRFVVRDGKIVGEEAWRNVQAQTAGGGGESDRFALPPEQETAGIEGDHRQYPDTSSLAAVDRINAIPTCDLVSCTWERTGGTSAPSPTLAGNLAVALSASRAAGGPARIGWLNPLLAAWAAAPHGPSVDLVDGSTAILGNTCCEAGRGYDRATGWGSIVDFGCIAAQLADDARPGRACPR